MLLWLAFFIAPLAHAQSTPPAWQMELEIISASLLTDPQQAIVRGQAFHATYDSVAPYDVRKRVDIHVAFAHALVGDVATAYQRLEALRLEIPSDRVELHALLQHTLGSFYFLLGDYSEASNYYFEALRLREKIHDQLAIADTINNIGQILRNNQRPAESIPYFKRVAAIGEQLQDAVLAGDGAISLTHTYIQLMQYDDAEKSLAQAREYFMPQHPHYWGGISVLATESELAILRYQGDRKVAQFEIAWQRAAKADLPRLQIEMALRQTRAFLTAADASSGLVLVERGLSVANRISSARDIADFTLLKAQLLLLAKKYQDAAMVYDAWHTMSRKFADERATLYTQLLQIRYQSAQKEQAIAELTKKSELQHLRLQQESWQKKAAIIGSILVLLVIVAGGLYWSHRRELKRQQATNNRLLELDRLKDQVLANTSHELRTPLNGIVGLSEVMLMEDISADHRNMLELIVRSGRRLSLLVNDLLDFAKLKHADIKLDKQRVAIKDAVTHALNLCQLGIGQKNLRLVNEIGDDRLCVSADPDRLQQILCNLINNGIKFSEVGVIRVHALAEATTLRIAISDNGIGIEPAVQNRIFEAFEQADGGLSRRHEGAGLGLAICKRLIELHGGQIGVQSTPGFGSMFWFTLPIV